MAAYQPLSVRRGIRTPSGPHEGVPPHLAEPLHSWLRDTWFDDIYGSIRDPRLLRAIAIKLELPIRHNSSDTNVLDQMLAQCADEDFCLDFIDATLQFLDFAQTRVSDLSVALTVGGSVWALAPDNKSLSERLDATARTQIADALSASDKASAELAEAWSKAFGRDPDASDAWDHSIKAVEEALRPVILPNDSGATLGKILGQLRGQPHLYSIHLADNALTGALDAMTMFENMLHFIWPNADRHGGGGPKPSLAQAQAVAQLAVTIVQWARAGIIKRR